MVKTENAAGKKPTREEVAMVELGQTTISRGLALALVLLLLVTIAVVPIVQHVHELRAGQTPQAWSVFATVPSERAYHEFERELEDRSVIGQAILPPMQRMLAAVGVGNEQAYLGPDGWLFFRPGFDYVVGRGFLEPEVLRARAMGAKSWEPLPQPDPVPAILDFRDQLAARGIELVLMPTTVKPQLDPTGTVSRAAIPCNNPSYPAWRAAMAAAGVRVFDPTETLAAMPQAFLKTDTHWTAAAMRTVAAELAAELRAQLPPLAAANYRSVTVPKSNHGDIATMLRLPAGQQLYAPETVTLEVVETADGQAWRPDTTADVLVLGDSFSNIYSLESMGWGEAAGFVESLSLLLQRPLDRITINDAGAVQTRRALRDELSRGRDRLAGKRLVVWQFAVRELAVGDWQQLDLPTVTAPARARSPVRVRARIAARSTPPQPGTVPYKDCLIAVELENVVATAGQWPAGEDQDGVLVYVEGMRDNVWTAATEWQQGAEIELALVPWEAAAEAVRSLNRRELDDDDLLLANPWLAQLP